MTSSYIILVILYSGDNVGPLLVRGSFDSVLLLVLPGDNANYGGCTWDTRVMAPRTITRTTHHRLKYDQYTFISIIPDLLLLYNETPILY